MRNSCWKRCWQDRGDRGPGCWDPHASFMLHTIVACFDFGRNYLPASKHRIRTLGFKYLNQMSAMMFYILLIGSKVIWFCSGMWHEEDLGNIWGFFEADCLPNFMTNSVWQWNLDNERWPVKCNISLESNAIFCICIYLYILYKYFIYLYKYIIYSYMCHYKCLMSL